MAVVAEDPSAHLVDIRLRVLRVALGQRIMDETVRDGGQAALVLTHDAKGCLQSSAENAFISTGTHAVAQAASKPGGHLVGRRIVAALRVVVTT